MTRIVVKTEDDINNLYDNLTAFSMIPLEVTTETDIDSFYDNYSSDMNARTWYRGVLNQTYSHSVLGNGLYYLEGYKTNSNAEWQIIISYRTTSAGDIRFFSRSKIGGSWSTWKER